MTMPVRTFSSFLKHSGEVLHEVEHHDVLLDRRDGPDVYLVTRERESAVREGLVIAAGVIDSFLKDPQLIEPVLRSVVESLPWVAWLTSDGRDEFVRRFVDTVRACSATAYYAPLQQLLTEWKASAQIQHDPELAALLRSGDDLDDFVPLARAEG